MRPRPTPGPWIAGCLAGTLLVGCGAPPPPVPVEMMPRPASESTRVLVVEDPAASVVAAALAFPGSGWELPGTEGLTLLTARTLLEQVRGPLDALDALVDVECGRALFTFTLVAPAESWVSALEVFLDGLFRPDPGPAALDSARARLARSLALDHASPAWQARLAARRALYGDSPGGSPWEAPACGVPENLPLFDLAHIRAGALRFAPRMARIGLVGPVHPDSATARVMAHLPTSAPPPLPAPHRTAPGFRHVERNTITAWTSHAFPFTASADVEALCLLGALVEDAFRPAAARPEVLSIRHEVERHGDGGALIVHVVTTPAAAPQYAVRIVDRVRSIAEDGVPDGVWDRVTRRHRGLRLLAREAPESRAAALVRGLALGTPPGDGWPDPGLTAERVRLAAERLGPAARSLVGPASARSGVIP